MKQKLIILLFVPIIILAMAVSAQAAPQVILDGKTLTFDVPPTVENGRTLVPLRAIFEALGADVQWNEATNSVIAKKDETEIKLIIGGKAFINNEEISLEVPAKVINGRTLVPLRFVAEAFSCIVVWDEKMNSIIIDAIQELSRNPKLLESKEYGFKINYPTNWLVSEKQETNTVKFFNMSENTGDCEERILIHVEFTEEPVDEVLTAKAMEEYLLYIFKNEGINILNSETTTLNGVGAAKVFYLQKEDNNYVKMVMITAAKDNRIYYVGGGDSIAEFPEFLETFNKMVDTFEFID